MYHGHAYQSIHNHVSQASSAPGASPFNWQRVIAPRLIPSKCPIPSSGSYKDGTNLFCSYLLVKEDRKQSESRDLLLAVARVKSDGPHPMADPLLILQGGPGDSALNNLNFFVSASHVKETVGNRDILLLDQRGTGYSLPSMQCDEESKYYQTSQLTNISQEEQIKKLDDTIRLCREALQSQWHLDLNEYTLMTDAQDVHDLVSLEDVPQVDIYGVSYGTRVALDVMRSFPQKIRSVVLDSTIPAQSIADEDLPKSTARVFHLLFRECAADKTCSQDFPRIEQRFWQFVASLDKQPITIPVTQFGSNQAQNVIFHGADLVQGFWSIFYSTRHIELIPFLMDQVMNKDYSYFASIYSSTLAATSIRLGTYHSMICSEDEARASDERIKANVQQLPVSIQQYYQLSAENALFQVCRIWGVRPLPSDEALPVKSAIPTLILEGQYDPIAPPAYGTLASQTLSHAVEVQFPETGHGVYVSGLSCPVEITDQFLQTPTMQPDTGCVKDLNPPVFQGKS